MKKNILFAFIVLVSLSSCEIIVHNEEPVFIDVRDKYLGTYRIEEYSDTYNEVSQFTLFITKSLHDADVVFLENFYGVNIDVLALVKGDRLVIPLQEVNGYEIQGEGWYEYDGLSFDYVVSDLTRYHVIHDYCSATAW